MAIHLTTGKPGSGMTLTHLTFDESVATRQAWNAHCAAAPSTPPVHEREPDGVPPVESPGLGVCISRYMLTYRCKSAPEGDLFVTEGGYSATDALLVLRSLFATDQADSVLVQVEKS